MKTYRIVAIIISLIITIITTGCNNSIETSKEKEIIQLKEEIANLKSELNVFEEKLKEKEIEYQNLFDEKNETDNKDEEKFNMSYISINKRKVDLNTSVLNEYGLNLGVFSNIVWKDIKLEILEYSKRDIGKYSSTNVPAKFKISFNGKSVEFEGVVYASSANGQPIADYIGGRFGEIRAKYIKSNIMINDKCSLGNLFDLLGIGYTYYDDNSIDIYEIVEG